MQCQHCNAILSTLGSLKTHQETSKKCLTLRGLPLNKQKRKLCSDPKCGKQAQGGTDKCITHGGGKRCSELGCGSSAQGGTDNCVTHGGGKRCSEPECGRSAQGGTDYCVTHGGGDRCSELGCGSSARSGSDKCITHGGGKRCSELGCESSAVGGTDKCITHGGGKRCSELGCGSSAVGGTDYCVTHGGGKRCTNCIDWIDSRCGDSKYDGYCATCFKRVFPDDPRSKVIYSHTKEIRVRNAISEYSETNKEFEGFIHDRPLYTENCDCTHKRRIDHRKLFGNTILAVETDEFRHRGYDEYDEEIRYDDLYMIHSGKWIFIRFNPDRTRTDKTDIKDRITQLLEEMENQIERIKNDENEELVEIIKMFY
jgi:hypothetical protein